MKRTHKIGIVSGVGLSMVVTLGAVGSATGVVSADSGQAGAAPVVQVAQVDTTTKGHPAPDAAAIRKLFKQWNATLATGNPEKVADRYAKDAVLLPTVSNKVRKTRAERVDYFTEFLKKKPSGKITSSTVKILNPKAAIDTGTYDFTLTVDGKKQIVPARYTFVYERIHGKWLIVNHHSSVEPPE